MASNSPILDVAIVGGGAAGLATAIFAARARPSLRIVILDGAPKLGAKILVSGGGRCNVTHATVSATEYFGGSRNSIKRVLAALPVDATIEFFREIGVGLHEEETGKLFPDSHSARTVLDALLGEVRRLGVEIRTGLRVGDVRRTQTEPPLFEIEAGDKLIAAERLVLATGGLSLPKTGSDGSGYALAKRLGHTIVPTTPGLVPLVLDGSFHTALAGLTMEVELAFKVDGEKAIRLAGSMLWTHLGISGPAAMDGSRIWHRARLENREIQVTACLLPGETFERLEGRLIAMASAHPRAQLGTMLATLLPARLAEAVLAALAIRPQTPMAHVAREDRRRLVNGLLAWPMPIRESRGYAHAEVTAGGVPLTEIDPSTMASRVCPGLYLVGEILDVDGRIGGYNFQWAWSGGCAAGRSIGG